MKRILLTNDDGLSSPGLTTLVNELLRFFHDPVLNPKNAQLLFATHDASLLNRRILRRDQVWFTEKRSSGATDLYSLHDIKDVRKGEAFEDGYLRGRYGAIPFFSRFDFPISEDEPAVIQEEETGIDSGPSTSSTTKARTKDGS